MGLFSIEKTVVVSSTVYNLAGDELDRPNFLKSSIFAATMNPHDAWLGETIVMNMLAGPGLKQRIFFNWANRNDIAGLPTHTATQYLTVDPAIVAPFITVPGSPAGLELEVQRALVSQGEYSYFADEWMLANHPELMSTDYISDYDPDAHTITIEYEGGGSDVFSAGIYAPDKTFIIAYHFFFIPASVEALVTGATTSNVIDAGLLPSTVGYSLFSTVNTGIVEHTLNTTKVVVKVYSNGDPTTEDTTYPQDIVEFNGTHKEYRKTIVEGGNGQDIETISKDYFYHLFELREIYQDVSVDIVVNDLGGGDTETVTTTITGDFLRPVYSWRIDTQDTIRDKVVGGNQMWFYEIGTGNATLDALLDDVTVEATGEYFPYLPVRLQNVSIADPVHEDMYEETEKAYRRASGGIAKFDDLVEEVDEHDDVGEIDFSYIQWGVSLNVIENSCRKYIYNYLLSLIPFQNTTSAYMAAFIADIDGYTAEYAVLTAWIAAQTNPADPLYDTPRPPTPVAATPLSTTFRLAPDHPDLLWFDNRLSWVNIDETLHSGLGKVGAEKGEVWIEKGTVFNWADHAGGNETWNNIEQIFVYWQTDDAAYKKLTVYGLIHHNYVYGGKAVVSIAHAALDDTDPSSLILPLHYPTMKAMSLKDTTQMATANTLIVFNAYQVFKKRWYETFWGMLLIIIVVIVISAIFAPGLVGGIAGIFGTNAAVGGLLGLSGTIGVIVGAITNALAAILVSTALQYGSVALFGEEWGPMIGAILGLILSFGLAGGFSMSLSDIFSPINLLKLTDVLAMGYKGYAASIIGNINQTMIDNKEQFDAEMKKINDMLKKLGGITDLSFNPLQLTDTMFGNDRGGSEDSIYLPESLNEFIHRTTMTGSDIVEVSLALISDYAELNLELPK